LRGQPLCGYTTKLLLLLLLIYFQEICDVQCSSLNLLLKIDPLKPVSNIIPKNHFDIVESVCCQETPIKTYFVLWTRSIGKLSSISWKMADKLCQSVGGNLPAVTDERDLSLLENLIIGGRFSSNRAPFYNPTRRHIRVPVFIGLDLSKVWFANLLSYYF